MTIRIEDLGAVGYGGAVTWSEWWDNKRIEEGKIGTKDIWKKASFYTYLGIGLTATLMSAFGWMGQFRLWTERLSIGFLYDMPRFAYNMSKTFSAGGGSRGGSAAAVKQAQQILRDRASARQITEGSATRRSYQPEFESVAGRAF